MKYLYILLILITLIITKIVNRFKPLDLEIDFLILFEIFNLKYKHVSLIKKKNFN